MNDTSEGADPVLALFDSLVRQNAAGCCGDDSWRGRLCGFHQGFESGLFCFEQVGPISNDEFISRTSEDEQLFGLTEEARRSIGGDS